MENLIFFIVYKGKYEAAKDYFQKIDVNVEQLDLDIEELTVSDVKEVSLDKAKKAYSVLKQPCFVEDSGFYIEAYPNKTNFPGTLVKRLGISNNIEALLETMKNIENRNCYFLSCITFYDGENIKQFMKKSEGTLSKTIRGEISKSSKSRLWQVFIPKGSNKTLAETSKEERYNNKENKSSTEAFVEWYKFNKICQISRKIKTKKNLMVVNNYKLC